MAVRELNGDGAWDGGLPVFFYNEFWVMVQTDLMVIVENSGEGIVKQRGSTEPT